MSKVHVGKASSDVILRKSVLSIFVVGMFLHASAQQTTENEYVQTEEESAIDLSKVVVTASGFSQAVKDAPASISVISGSELTDKPISGLGAALKDVEGVSVERGGKSGGANISIRGLPSDYTLILIDGKRLSQNSSGARPNGFGDVDSNFIPPTSAIEQIEVVRGPMSTLYGSDAMGGVVNIITKKVPEKWGGEVNVGFIQPESSKFSKHLNTGLYAAGPLVKDTLGLALTAGYDHSTDAKGRYAINEAERLSGDYTGRYNEETGMGKKKNYNVGGKLSFTPNGENDIILSYDRGVQRYDNSDEQLGDLNTNMIAQGKDGGGYGDELKFTRDRASISHQGRYDAVTVDSSILWDETKTIGRLNPVSKPAQASDGTNRDIKYTNIILDNKWMFGLGDHFISLGGQYRHQKLVDTLAESPFDVKQWQWALFLEDEWSITDNFIATFGLRYDKNEAFGDHYSPRVYLTWNIDDSWQIKGGVSQAFKAPDMQLTQDGVIGLRRKGKDPILGTPDLKAETSTSSELGVYFDNNSNFSANATVFYTKFNDKIESVKTSCAKGQCIANGTLWPNAIAVYQSFNVNDAKLYGIELGGRYQFTEQVGFKLNYTYTESSFIQNDIKRPFSATPKHMVNAKVDWQINEAWNVWAEAEYRGKQFNDLNWNDDKVYYKSYGLVNLGAKYSATDNLSFTAGIYNLFDKNFMDMEIPRVGTSAPAANADFANRYRRNEEGRRFWVAAKYVF